MKRLVSAFVVAALAVGSAFAQGATRLPERTRSESQVQQLNRDIGQDLQQRQFQQQNSMELMQLRQQQYQQQITPPVPAPVTPGCVGGRC
jgi:hypothetical protein